jgi:hypothetical protein
MKVRGLNRLAGRGTGYVTGKAAAKFGVWGLVGTAEFFHFLKVLVAARAGEGNAVWVGSMANYALWIDRGWTHHKTGKKYPARPWFRLALKQAEEERSRFRGGFNYPRLPTVFNPSAKSVTRTRTGIYEGQKFLGDFTAFFHQASISAVGSRYARREAGRQVSGVLFSALKKKRNPMEVFAEAIVRHARQNLVPISDTGFLRASVAMGPTEADFMLQSTEQAMAHGRRRGLPDAEIKRRLPFKTSSSGGQYMETLGQDFAKLKGIEMPR